MNVSVEERELKKFLKFSLVVTIPTIHFNALFSCVQASLTSKIMLTLYFECRIECYMVTCFSFTKGFAWI
jgi:hypothetical protein